ncbi:MAG: hypothetical protein P8P91_06625 [Pseudomonadales bacterium]|jgi:hypothetical protein|nr:hypothetical protein [Pseudomonadales bacterium]
MKAFKTASFALLAYVGIVILFESSLGYFQPRNENTLLLSMQDTFGQTHDRVLSPFELNDELYVAVNHWPRQWYKRLKANPSVTLVYQGESKQVLAVTVTETAELSQITEAYQLGFLFRLLTGFPPRAFVRLEDSVKHYP